MVKIVKTRLPRPPGPLPPAPEEFLGRAAFRHSSNYDQYITLFIYILYRNRNCSVFY